MHNFRLEDLQFDAQPLFSPSAWNFDGQISTGSVIRSRRTVRRHRTDLSWIPVTLFALAALTTVCVFAKSLAEPSDAMGRSRSVAKPGKSRTVSSQSHEAGNPKQVAVKPADSVHQPKISRPAEPAQEIPAPVTPRVKHDPETSTQVAEAVWACRQGRFDEAKNVHAKACGPRGQAVCLLADYLRQYETLSREAILRMNGAVEVDLGPNYGLGAFVERVDSTVVFMCRGQHVRLTVDELLDLTAVRFRITRQFLANGEMPANDLILAAAHYVHGIDDKGLADTDGGRALSVARNHLMVALSASDPAVAVHAKLLLSLING